MFRLVNSPVYAQGELILLAIPDSLRSVTERVVARGSMPLLDHPLFRDGAAFETLSLRGVGQADLRLHLDWFSAA